MAVHVNAGELRHKIRIVERNTQRDRDGYQVHRDDPAYWKTVRKCCSRFTPISGTETLKAGADFTVERARFLVRWTRTPLHRKMFVLFRGKEWEIIHLNDFGGRQYVEILAEWRSGKDGAGNDDQ